MKEVAPPPKAVKGEMGAFPVDFWGGCCGQATSVRLGGEKGRVGMVSRPYGDRK